MFVSNLGPNYIKTQVNGKRLEEAPWGGGGDPGAAGQRVSRGRPLEANRKRWGGRSSLELSITISVNRSLLPPPASEPAVQEKIKHALPNKSWATVFITT